MSEENKQAMESAIQTLNQLATSHSTPKNFKKTISEYKRINSLKMLSVH